MTYSAARRLLRANGCCAACILWLATLAAVAPAAENGGSVYPAGVETVMPGMMPGAGQTMFLEFNNFYQANATVDGSGHSVIPGFHLRVAALAPKFVHNWGIGFLGGELVRSIAMPILYEHLDGPFGKFEKTGNGNADIGVLDVAYSRGPWHWWYGIDVYLPGFRYDKNALLNVGQHYFATAPEWAFTYLPRRRTTEISSKFQYVVSAQDGATDYRSGQEFIGEYDAMQNVTGKLAAGASGYYCQQTSDDVQNGTRIGNRGRVVGVGPELRYHMGRTALILKYQRETLVANRTRGNSFWVQMGVPIGHSGE
jgi:hypothetical protein